MRKLISILLLAAFALPLLAALSAAAESPESRLPACCRRNGAHHCSMSAEEMAQLLAGQHFTTLHATCPLYPKATAQMHHPPSWTHTAPLALQAYPSLPVKLLQIQLWARIAQRGAPHKRGPPTGYSS